MKTEETPNHSYEAAKNIKTEQDLNELRQMLDPPPENWTRGKLPFTEIVGYKRRALCLYVLRFSKIFLGLGFLFQ